MKPASVSASAGLPARADTTRIVEWDELPESVRSIPADFDPLADGVLMKHQREWAAIDVPLAVAKKGRRTGITYAEALRDTVIAAKRKDAGGDSVYYIPDAKEKGLEFIGYCAHMARVMAEAQAVRCSSIEEFMFDDQQPDGSTRQIASYRIRFASGNSIVALSSRPAAIRGLQGIVVIDEAAYHQDVQAVLDAATALLIWGGKIRVISTLNSTRNPFWQLIQDIEKGRYGDTAKVYTATFDDAVANGLFERVCLMRRTKATPEAKAAWYASIRKAYGPRRAAMLEELDAVPREGAGASIPGVWIDRAMSKPPQPRPVLRLVLDDAFVHLGNQAREDFIDAWIATHLVPALKLLNPKLSTVFGMDYARHRDFTVFVPVQITQTLGRKVPFVIELQNVPSRQQKAVLWRFIRGLVNFCGGAMDATGPGQTLAEDTADEFGHDCIHQVVLNLKWYAEWMPKMVQRFEDDDLDIPRDASHDDDLRAVEEINGIPMVATLRRADLKEPELKRHGDFAIGLVMAEFAAVNAVAPIEFRSDSASSQRADDFAGFLHG
jgi:phage FluMu gp28-like protein